MDTRELASAINELERDIGTHIREKLADFKKQSGLCVSGIRVSFVDVTHITDTLPQYQINEVDVSVNL